MGDVGSAFLGFTLAVLVVLGGLAHPRLPLAGVFVVWPFVFDITFTILRRLRRGENIFAAHRSHLYQRLVIAGYRHRTVTLLWTLDGAGSGLLIALSLPVLCWGLWAYVVYCERRRSQGVMREGEDERGRGGG